MTFDRKHYRKTKIYIINIYLKNNKKKPFCEIEIEDITVFNDLLNELNNIEKNIQVIKFGQVIFNRADFDYATVEEKIDN